MSAQDGLAVYPFDLIHVRRVRLDEPENQYYCSDAAAASRTKRTERLAEEDWLLSLRRAFGLLIPAIEYVKNSVCIYNQALLAYEPDLQCREFLFVQHDTDGNSRLEC